VITYLMVYTSVTKMNAYGVAQTIAGNSDFTLKNPITLEDIRWFEQRKRETNDWVTCIVTNFLEIPGGFSKDHRGPDDELGATETT
jgi:hypothetical protein